MAKIFISYKFDGEKKDELERDMKKLCDSLRNNKHETYCTLFDKDLPIENKKLFDRSYKELEDSDVILVLLKSEDKSEGLLMEVGYAVANNKKIILAINDTVRNTCLRDLIDDVIEFSSVDDLVNKISEVDL